MLFLIACTLQVVSQPNLFFQLHNMSFYRVNLRCWVSFLQCIPTAFSNDSCTEGRKMLFIEAQWGGSPGSLDLVDTGEAKVLHCPGWLKAQVTHSTSSDATPSNGLPDSLQEVDAWNSHWSSTTFSWTKEVIALSYFPFPDLWPGTFFKFFLPHFHGISWLVLSSAPTLGKMKPKAKPGSFTLLLLLSL